MKDTGAVRKAVDVRPRERETTSTEFQRNIGNYMAEVCKGDYTLIVTQQNRKHVIVMAPDTYRYLIRHYRKQPEIALLRRAMRDGPQRTSALPSADDLEYFEGRLLEMDLRAALDEEDAMRRMEQ